MKQIRYSLFLSILRYISIVFACVCVSTHEITLDSKNAKWD